MGMYQAAWTKGRFEAAAHAAAALVAKGASAVIKCVHSGCQDSQRCTPSRAAAAEVAAAVGVSVHANTRSQTTLDQQAVHTGT